MSGTSKRGLVRSCSVSGQWDNQDRTCVGKRFMFIVLSWEIAKQSCLIDIEINNKNN